MNKIFKYPISIFSPLGLDNALKRLRKRNADAFRNVKTDMTKHDAYWDSYYAVELAKYNKQLSDDRNNNETNNGSFIQRIRAGWDNFLS